MLTIRAMTGGTGYAERHLAHSDYYVRQMRDMKVAPDLTGYTPALLASYGRVCGRTLARAHAKSGDACAIAGYLGSGDQFDVEIGDFAVAYADQNDRDFAALKAAVRSGKVTACNET